VSPSARAVPTHWFYLGLRGNKNESCEIS